MRVTGPAEAAAVVCVNGGRRAEVPGTWSPTLEWLVERLAPAFPGIGFAEVRYRIKSWQRLELCVEDTLAALEALAPRRALLLGFSMGGAVAIRAAGHPSPARGRLAVPELPDHPRGRTRVPPRRLRPPLPRRPPPPHRAPRDLDRRRRHPDPLPLRPVAPLRLRRPVPLRGRLAPRRTPRRRPHARPGPPRRAARPGRAPRAPRPRSPGRGRVRAPAPRPRPSRPGHRRHHRPHPHHRPAHPRRDHRPHHPRRDVSYVGRGVTYVGRGVS
jgi:hypothetical protein